MSLHEKYMHFLNVFYSALLRLWHVHALGRSTDGSLDKPLVPSGQPELRFEVASEVLKELFFVKIHTKDNPLQHLVTLLREDRGDVEEGVSGPARCLAVAEVARDLEKIETVGLNKLAQP